MILKTCSINILASSFVVLVAGAEDANYPLYRLWDRNIGRLFKATLAETIEIKIDQGGSPVAADSLIIPSGHNLTGSLMGIRHSDDDIDYTNPIADWVPAAGLMVKSWGASVTKQYWKVAVQNPTSIPQFAELFIGPTYEWERNPSRPTGELDDIFNVEREVDAGGRPRYLVHGDPRRRRYYPNCRGASTQKANILALNAAWGGAKPFWLYDHEGEWIFGELIEPLSLREEGGDAFRFGFNFLEVLP